jgi:hypothetical protein
MVNSATRAWSEIAPRSQALRRGTMKKSVIFSLFSLACRADWIFTRIKSGDFFGLNKQQQQTTKT